MSTRFVNAYNLLDHSLRTQYNFKTNISFSDLIRRCASLNQVIRAYEDDLIDLARLRNAIVHHNSDKVIAEPHEDVVELLEKIARIISTPPLAIEIIKSVRVETIPATAMLIEYILQTERVGHSNIPVYRRNTLIGVLHRHIFVEAIAKVAKNGRSLDSFLSGTTVEQYLCEFPSNNHFTIVSAAITIEQVLALFNNNRKITSIIVTTDGTASGILKGIITPADILDMMNIMEGF